jgi:SAM-dependent methyltransferase
MMAETGIEFPLVEADAEDVPLPDGSFDLALSEYGASIWCDPARWIPEAHRLLRRDGVLVFLCNTPLSILCMPDEGKIEERLVRSQFELGRMQWPGEDEGVEYHLGHGDMLRLLRETGFEVEGLWELRAPESASDHAYYDFVPAAWARRWPAEEIWKARKRA